MPNAYPTITTVEQLREVMSSVDGEAARDSRLFWFVCICNATAIGTDYSLKDLAHLLLEGVEPTNKLSDVQDFLDTYYEGCDESDLYIQGLHIMLHIYNFYGLSEQAQQVEDLIETEQDRQVSDLVS